MLVKQRSAVGITVVPEKKWKDSVGDQYGHLIIVGVPFYARTRRDSETHVVCRCECGKYIVLTAYRLRVGHTGSCGCQRYANVITHKQSKTRLYNIWCGIKSRCRCLTNVAWRYYGGCGIDVCPEWLKTFISFADWATTSGYQDNLTIDRIDPDGDYTPTNCRWITWAQQAANKRKLSVATTSRYKGVSWCSNVGKWRVQIQNNGRHFHLGLFASEEKAARKYNATAKRMFGNFAHVNVIGGSSHLSAHKKTRRSHSDW